MDLEYEFPEEFDPLAKDLVQKLLVCIKDFNEEYIYCIIYYVSIYSNG